MDTNQIPNNPEVNPQSSSSQTSQLNQNIPQNQSIYTNTNASINQNPQNVNTFKPAGAWVRFWAGAIDGLIIGIPAFLIISLIFFLVPNIISYFPNYLNNIWISLLFQVLLLIYAIYLNVNKGATWGKDAYGLKVIKYKTDEKISYWQAFLREIIKAGLYIIPIFSGLFSVLNGFFVIFSSEKRGLHDKIAGTQVVKYKNTWSMGKQILIILPLILALIAVAVIFTRLNMSIQRSNIYNPPSQNLKNPWHIITPSQIQ